MPESNVILAPAVGFDIGDTKLSHQTGDHNGWLLCSAGRTVSRTTYAALFAAIGTTYGSGDGSTTFNLPDPMGRAIGAAGAGSGLTSRAVGASVGNETQGLSASNIPTITSTWRWGHGAPANTGTNTYGGASNSGVTATERIGTAIVTGAISSNNTSGSAHNNMQPTYFMGNPFIYAG